MHYLQDQEKEAVANFKAITETWDDERAVEALRRHNWDVTEASNDFFTGSFEDEEPQEPVYRSPSAPRKLTWETRINSFFTSIWRAIVPEEIRGENSKSALDFSTKVAEASPALNFSSLQFQELLQFSQEVSKKAFIIISLHDEETAEWLREPSLVRALNREYVCWGVNFRSKEGEMLESQLKIEGFPFAMILRIDDPKRPGVLDRMFGAMTSEKILRFVEKQSQYISPEIIAERELREKQEEELRQAEALAVLREAERKQAEERRFLELEQKAKEKSDRKKYLLEKIKTEPEFNEFTIQVSFKLSSGKRMDRIFARSDLVQSLFDYLEYVDVRALDLLTGFPPRSLTEKNLNLEEAGFDPRCVIHVREANN